MIFFKDKNNNPLQKKIIIALVCILFFSILYYTSSENYLLFHTLIEIFGIIIACVIFTIAWNLRNRISNNYILFLGYAYIFRSLLDILHMLAYQGMNIFTGHPGANLATQLWISARYVGSITLFIAPFFLGRKIKQPLIVLSYAVITLFIISSIFFWDIFPVCYADPAGLTDFKIISEYIISAIFLFSIFSLLQKKAYFSSKVLNLLIAAIIFKIFSELSFTAYISVYGFMNFLGHIFRFISYYCIYTALISIGLKNPFELILKDLQDRTKEYVHEIEFIKAVIDIADVLVIVYDADGRILLFNKTCQKLTGYTIEEVKDKPYWEYFIRKDDMEGVKKIFEDLKKGNYPDPHNIYWKMKDDSLKLISWSKTILLDKDKNAVYIVAAGRDITHITNLERENKNIVSMIAHDMKSPLLSIQLFSNQLIKKWNKLNDIKKNEYLNIIHKEGERLNALIDEFLEFSLMHHGFISLDFKTLNPADLINYISDVYKIKAKEKGIKINTNCTFNDEIIGDSLRLNRVLTNLLDNAIKFSNKNNTINVNAYKADNFLRIEVEDNGAGIAEEDLPNIFHPFMRGKEASEKSGYGVGLAYVKSVIEKHNGTILVQSELGKGTRFTILLPLAYHDNITANYTEGIF